jgi:hypothetical protein
MAELSPSAATTRSYVAASSPTSGDAELATAVLEDLEQPAPAHRGEAVAAAGDDLAVDVHVDVVPDRELPLHPLIDRRIRVLDAAQRLVAEDDAEAEGVVGGVALPDRDLVVLPGGRRQLLGERREVEPSRTPTDHRDPHPASALPG